MEYRRLGRTGLMVSAIGLGTEHLVQTGENMGEVFRVAVDAGVNYIDVLYSDPEADASFWDSITPELNRYRKRLFLMAHWGPSDQFPDPAKCQQSLELALKQVTNRYLEGVMLTVVDSEAVWNGWAKESMERLRPYKEQGRIGFIGLSGHNAPVVIKAAQSGLIDVLMFPINLLGHDDPVVRELYRVCAEQDAGLVAMKVYNGGTLLSIKDEYRQITPVKCLHYTLSQPVATVVPGVRNADEMRETLQYLTASDAERDYSAIPANIHEILAGQCTYCQHCLPCPQEIEISGIIWNLDQVKNRGLELIREWYSHFRVKASACIECGDCLVRCPFHVEIIAKMREAAALLEINE